jgi:hypothetical protein
VHTGKDQISRTGQVQDLTPWPANTFSCSIVETGAAPIRSARPIDRIAPARRRCFAADDGVLLLFPKAARPALRKEFFAAGGSSAGAIGLGAALKLELIDRITVSLVPQFYSGALVCVHHLL